MRANTPTTRRGGEHLAPVHRVGLVVLSLLNVLFAPAQASAAECTPTDAQLQKLADKLPQPPKRRSGQRQQAATPQTVRAATACPVLFGDQEVVARNSARREQVLEAVEARKHTVDVVTQERDWRSPQSLRLQGVALVDTVELSECGKAALIRVPPATAERMACPAGYYVAQRDHALGQVRILAILDDVLLVERGSAIEYFAAADAAKPAFRLWWHPPWSLRPAQQGKASSSSRSAKKSRAARRRARKRARRRRLRRRRRSR